MSSPDPTAGFTDMQWYMYHQRNVAFFAAFAARRFSDDDLLAAARALVELAPQLRTGFIGGSADTPIPDPVLRALIYKESVATLDGFPERWVDRGDAVLADPALPLFRIRYAEAATPSADGRAGFILVQVSHALVEGADFRAAHALAIGGASGERQQALDLAAGEGCRDRIGAVLASLHVLAGNLVTLRPGPFRFAMRAYPRRLFSDLARQYDVRQRALFFALVMHTLFDTGTRAGKRRITSTYSVIDEGGGADRDTYMRMRMRFASFANAPDFASFVHAVDARLTEAENKESGFNAEMNAEGIRLHRRFSRLVPFAYTPKLFQFMPYDVVIGLIPPHRLGGGLTAGLLEPVYAGAALEGANACVIVPNRRQVSFNFYIEEKLLPRVERLDSILTGPVISGSPGPG